MLSSVFWNANTILPDTFYSVATLFEKIFVRYLGEFRSFFDENLGYIIG